MSRIIDLSGQTFGALTVVSRAGSSSAGNALWLTSCACGNENIVIGSFLRGGHVTSCGCKRVRTHGHTVGGKHSPEFSSWHRMVQRCTNPNDSNWAYYGGRGIGICTQWRAFDVFLADMGERPAGTSLDRIDNTRGYEPGNVRWATKAEQQQNTRLTRLTPDIVRAVRTRVAAGERQASVARAFGLTRAKVSTIVSRKAWANVV